MECEDTVATQLEAFLTRKQQRKKRKETRAREEEKRRAAEVEEKKERQRRAAKLRIDFPSLKKTLHEIRDFDLTLPPDLATTSVEASVQDDVTSNAGGFSWKHHPNGLEDRLKGSRGNKAMALKEREGDKGKGEGPKRRREPDVTSNPRWRKERRLTSDAKTMGVERRKPQRRMVVVEREKVKDIISPVLLKFYDLAVRTLSEMDISAEIEVRLLMKKILCPVQLEFSTREFFVQLSVVDRPIGLSVGYTDALLYVKEFQKEGEALMKERLEQLDPCDPGFPPASFPKKDKLCYQWLQRMVGNAEGIFFTASDLLGVQRSISMQGLLTSLAGK